MVEDKKVRGKLISAALAIGLAIYFFAAYDGWWPFAFAALVAVGIIFEMRSIRAGK